MIHADVPLGNYRVVTEFSGEAFVFFSSEIASITRRRNAWNGRSFNVYRVSTEFPVVSAAFDFARPGNEISRHSFIHFFFGGE